MSAVHPVHQGLRAFVHAHSGICLGPDKDYLLESRLPGLLGAQGLQHAQQLLELVRQQPRGEAASALISALATHETSWFRDPRMFEVLRQQVLPQWRARGLPGPSIWSAACSTGQEPYSLAMLLEDEGLAPPQGMPQLLASDICEASLLAAREGRYSAFDAARGLPRELLERHFTRQDAGWQLRPGLRQRVRFERINLLQLPAGLGPFDAVFCRNVLIYFDPGTRRQVLRALHARLAPGGWLFLGTAEWLEDLEDARLDPGPAPGIYRRAGLPA